MTAEPADGRSQATVLRLRLAELNEAEAILDGDRETAVALLMRVGELIEANRRLEARVAELEQRDSTQRYTRVTAHELRGAVKRLRVPSRRDPGLATATE